MRLYRFQVYSSISPAYCTVGHPQIPPPNLNLLPSPLIWPPLPFTSNTPPFPLVTTTLLSVPEFSFVCLLACLCTCGFHCSIPHVSDSTWFLTLPVWSGLDFSTEHRLWAVACILALLQTRLDFVHSEMDEDGTSGSQEGNPLNWTSYRIHTTDPHPPVLVSGKSFPLDIARTCFPPVTMPHFYFSWNYFRKINHPLPQKIFNNRNIFKSGETTELFGGNESNLCEGLLQTKPYVFSNKWRNDVHFWFRSLVTAKQSS